MAGSDSARARRLWAAGIGFGLLLGLALPAVVSAQRERGRDEKKKKVVKMVVQGMTARPPKPKPLESVELLVTVENQGPDASERPSALYFRCQPVSGGPCPWKSPIKVSLPPLGVGGRHVTRFPAGKFPPGTYRLTPATVPGGGSGLLLVVGGSSRIPNPGPPEIPNPGPPDTQAGPPTLGLDPAVLAKLSSIQPPAAPSEGLRAISVRPGQKLLLEGGMSLVAWSPSSGSEAGIARGGPTSPRNGGALLLLDSSGRIRKRFPATSQVQQDSARAVWVNVKGQAHLVGKLPPALGLPAVQ